ncbi:hypothetical protein ACNOYE_03690 [Nannocystaceae bacterium ST9]
MSRRAIVATCSLFLGCTPGDVSLDDEVDESAGETEVGETDSSETGTSETGTDETDSGTETDEQVCATPLPPEAFDPENQLAFGIFFGGLELSVGSSRQFEVGIVQCCVFWEAIPTCSVYSVEPADAGASIDPVTGLLTLADDVVDGSVFSVTANVEDGLAIVEDSVFAYRPEQHPLKGYWHEVARIPCGGGPEFAPSDPINELYFTAAGEVGVTWTPFEVYVDYTADYVAALDAGTLSITDPGGNYVPGDIDGEGLFSLVGGELVLEDMWLGSSQGSVEPPGCGHRFAQ